MCQPANKLAYQATVRGRTPNLLGKGKKIWLIWLSLSHAIQRNKWFSNWKLESWNNSTKSLSNTGVPRCYLYTGNAFWLKYEVHCCFTKPVKHCWINSIWCWRPTCTRTKKRFFQRFQTFFPNAHRYLAKQTNTQRRQPSPHIISGHKQWLMHEPCRASLIHLFKNECAWGCTLCTVVILKEIW